MPFEESSGYCSVCQRSVLVRRQVPNHLVHALVTFFLCGLWLPVWIWVALFGGSRWRCTHCGRRV